MRKREGVRVAEVAKHYARLREETVSASQFKRFAPSIRKVGFSASTMAAALKLLQYLITQAHVGQVSSDVVFASEYAFTASFDMDSWLASDDGDSLRNAIKLFNAIYPLVREPDGISYVLCANYQQKVFSIAHQSVSLAINPGILCRYLDQLYFSREKLITAGLVTEGQFQRIGAAMDDIKGRCMQQASRQRQVLQAVDQNALGKVVITDMFNRRPSVKGQNPGGPAPAVVTVGCGR